MDVIESEGSVVQVMDSLGFGRGGLTRAVFDRFSHLSAGRRSILVTVAYQPKVRSVFNRLKSDGVLPAHTELLNYFEDQRVIPRPLLQALDQPHQQWEMGAPYQAVVEPSAQGRTVRYFHLGTFVGLVYRSDSGLIGHVDHHRGDSPWIRDFRDTFWPNGSLSRREFYDDRNQARFRIYVGTDGRPFLTSWVNEKGYEYRTVEHTPTGSALHGDMRASNAAWLERKLSNLGECIVFNDEPRTTFALSVGLPNVRHVASIHTTHRVSDSGDEPVLKQWVGPYQQFIDNIEFLIFFTEAQRQEFCVDASFPPAKTLVISHPLPTFDPVIVEDPARSTNSVVIVSRLAADKRIDEAIKAFDIVKREFPGLSLEIWGTGPERSALDDLIVSLGLEADVVLKGYTDDPMAQFARSGASIVTTRFEGFGLVIIESLAAGTPVVAYDVKYGPREILSTQEGALVEDGNMIALAEALSSSLQDSDLDRNALSQEASERYSRARWCSAWGNLLK